MVVSLWCTFSVCEFVSLLHSLIDTIISFNDLTSDLLNSFLLMGAVGMHRCAHWIWGSRCQAWVSFLICYLPYFWDSVSPIRQVWLASETQVLPVSSSPVQNHKYTQPHLNFFKWLLRIKLRFSYYHEKYFTNSVIPPRPKCCSVIKQYHWTRVHILLLIFRKHRSEELVDFLIWEVSHLLSHALRLCPSHS